MLAKVRAFVKGALSAFPVYRVLPPSSLRDYAAIHHLAEKPKALISYVESSRTSGTSFFSTGWLAARAAYHTESDITANQVLTALSQRFPDVSDVHWLRGELETFHGEYVNALSHATHARLLDPTSIPATVSTVRLHYLAVEECEADTVAVGAVRTFPRSVLTLYAACSECRSVEQFERLAVAWERTVTDSAHIRAAARPLALAAARAGRFETAVSLYIDAILLTLQGIGPRSLAPGPSLGGKRAWDAIRDIRDALTGAGIPFFFAAGTALGLVRDGRPLSHDSDVDVGVFEDDWDRGELGEAFRRHPAFRPVPTHPRAEKIGLEHRGGSPVDVFRFYEEDGQIWHDGSFIRWRNSPFDVAMREVRGLALPLPAPSDRYLTENYGQWRDPDPGYDAFLEAPNAEVRSTPYRDYYLVRRAYLRLNAGEVGAAIRDLDEASDTVARTDSGANLLDILSVGERREPAAT